MVKTNLYRVFLYGKQAAIFKMDNRQGPAVEHKEFCSVLCGSLDGRGVWGRVDTCVCMAEAPCCSPETITTLLIIYTPIQNKKKIKRKQAKFTNAKTCI